MTTTATGSGSQNNRPTAKRSGSAGLSIKRPGQIDWNVQAVPGTGCATGEVTAGAVTADCAAYCRGSFTRYTVVSF